MDCSTEKKKKYNNIKLPEHGTRNSHFHVTYKSFIAALYIVVNCTFLIYLAGGQMSLFLTQMYSSNPECISQKPRPLLHWVT